MWKEHVFSALQIWMRSEVHRLTRLEENQENKDYFICVFSLWLGKVIFLY